MSFVSYPHLVLLIYNIQIYCEKSWQLNMTLVYFLVKFCQISGEQIDAQHQLSLSTSTSM